MLKRTKGRILLTLLVITGLAGTLNESVLTSKERKFAVGHLKESRSDFIKSIKGLSEEQLNFRAAEGSWSIKECVYHITLTEKGIWGMFEATMKGPVTPENRSKIKTKDEDVPAMVVDRTNKVKAPESMRPEKAPWKTVDEAIAEFKVNRADHLKYIKSTTEDLRNHTFDMPVGTIDGYQMILFMSAHSQRHTAQIKEVKANPAFPK